MKDEAQEDTGYLILSLTETMEESRRLRQEIRSGARVEELEAGSSAEVGRQAPPLERA